MQQLQTMMYNSMRHVAGTLFFDAMCIKVDVLTA